MQTKSSTSDAIKKYLWGWTKLHTEAIKDDGTIIDGHPLPGKLIVFRKFPTKDESKNTITKRGNSLYLLISENTMKFICNSEETSIKNNFMFGYNEIDNHHLLVIDCGLKEGGEPTNE